MAQPGKGFKSRIDPIANPELLEHKWRSLQRPLGAARDPKQFRKAAAKTTYIVDRLKMLVGEESGTEVDQ